MVTCYDVLLCYIVLPGTEYKHPSIVLDSVQLVIEHPVPAEHVMPQQHQHSVQNVFVPETNKLDPEISRRLRLHYYLSSLQRDSRRANSLCCFLVMAGWSGSMSDSRGVSLCSFFRYSNTRSQIITSF